MTPVKLLDETMMRRALHLAINGLYTTHPNPRVGCVIAHHDRIVGEGWHVKAGDAHAEVNALKLAGHHAKGGTAYVTLEPCSHMGRTPPCVDALINAGIKRVVYGMKDPNHLVNGQGLEKLKIAGIVVDGPVCELQARELNAGFIRRMQLGLPLVRLKMGMSADGRTALLNGTSKWITSEAARDDVQYWRARSSAILTSIGTVLADDPLMNVRAENLDLQGRQPMRVICDTHLRTPATARIVQSPGALLYTNAIPHVCGQAEVVRVSINQAGRVELETVLRDLARRECNEVLVEAGATLCGDLLARKLVNEVVLYVAPVLLGHDARGLFNLPVISTMSDRIEMQLLDTMQLGSDIRLRYKII